MKNKILFTSLITLMLLVGITGVALAGEIHVKHASLDNHQGECLSGGGYVTYWHFVITDMSDEIAPASIHVVWNNGAEADVALFKVSGGAAHYETYENAGNLVVDATAFVPDSWGGQFNLSHVTCQSVQDLTVSKTANPTYTRTFDWTIDKSADKQLVYSAGGGPSEPVNYTVTVTKDAGTDSDWAVSGSITVNNPNNFAVMGVNITDGVCLVTGGADVTVPANGSVTASYICNLGGPIDGTNIATVTWPDIGSPNTNAIATAGYIFGNPTILVNDEIDVTDTNGKSWHFSASGSETYQISFNDPAGTCTDHVNTATIVGLGDSASVTVTDCQGADLIVRKTAVPSYDLTYTWSIEKDVDLTYIRVDPGQPVIFNYTVTGSHDLGTESNWQVNGVITVANPNDWQAIVATVTDVLAGGSCTITGNPVVTVPASGSIALPYSCTFPSNPTAGTNFATAVWNAATYHTPNGFDLGEAAFVFGDPTNLIDECINVSDSQAGPLGTVCVGNPNPYAFTYSKTFYGPSGGTCEDHDNVATFLTNDQGATGSASAEVRICSWKGRLTPGYWKNHLAFDPRNVQNPFTAHYLPQLLGPYSVNTTTQATAIWNLMNCSNTGTASKLNQNAIGCLAGHLLATKLNVANGANTCIQPTINAADAFLTSIPYSGPSGNYSGLATANRNTAISLKSLLDAYNNGNGCH